MDIFEENDLGDFKKLLFANKFIEEQKKEISELKKELKKTSNENGVLKSEKDELEYLLKKENPENNKVRSYVQQIKGLERKIKRYKRLYDDLTLKTIQENIKRVKENQNKMKIHKVIDETYHRDEADHDCFVGTKRRV